MCIKGRANCDFFFFINRYLVKGPTNPKGPIPPYTSEGPSPKELLVRGFEPTTLEVKVGVGKPLSRGQTLT